MKNFYIFRLIILCLFFCLIEIQTTKANDVKIISKINNDIITNIDIENEANYLRALNKDLNNINKSDLLEISKNSLIKELLKKNEIIKFTNIKNFSNDKLLNSILKNFYINLGLQNENEFKKFLNDNNLNLEEVKQKIIIEILWNQLIGRLYNNQIFIDEKKIRQKINKQKLDVQNSIEYDLSEIIFEVNQNENLNSKFAMIKDDISKNGFNITANKFSISDSSKFGGKLGKINKNKLSEIIQQKLENISLNGITDPIKVGAGYLILKINDKKEIENAIDEEKLFKQLISIEREKQFNQYSLIYFNKVKLNSTFSE